MSLVIDLGKESLAYDIAKASRKDLFGFCKSCSTTKWFKLKNTQMIIKALEIDEARTIFTDTERECLESKIINNSYSNCCT
jgi:hypothetical protein